MGDSKIRKQNIIILILSCYLFSQVDSVYMHLPDFLYTTTTSEFSIYYNNLIRGRFVNKEQVTVNCEVGYPDSMKYNLDSLETGLYDLNIQVCDSLGNFIEQSETKIIVTNVNSQTNDTVRVLFIGDSFTYDGVYLNTIQSLYQQTSYYPIIFLGSNYSYPNYLVRHEGYIGKYWSWFANNLENPFVFETYGKLEINRYIQEKLIGEYPDFIVIFLGINDIGSGDPASIGSIDERIDDIFNDNGMTKLIDSLVTAIPEARLGIVLTPPVNEREETYINPETLDYWERKLMHHRLCQRYSDHFKLLDKPSISVIPVNVNIDTWLGFDGPNGFDASNSIHPNNYGYSQIGHSIFGWLKFMISNAGEEITIRNVLITVNRFSVDISWDYPLSGLTYNIYRSADPYGVFALIGTTTNLYFTDTNISGLNHYFYKVTAGDSLK